MYKRHPTIVFAIGVISIYIVYILSATLNAKMFSHPYPRIKQPGIQDYFVYADLILISSGFFSSLAGFAVSHFILKEGRNPLPLKQLSLLGTLFTCRVSCFNYALYFVPFATRVVWDKVGYFVTVVVSVFFSRYPSSSKKLTQSYKLKTAFIISFGSLFFAYHHAHDKPSDHYQQSDAKFGYALLFIAVIGKGFFADNQSYCKFAYNVTMHQLLYTVNFISALLSLFLLTIKQQIVESFMFCLTHRRITEQLITFTILSVIGQLLIYNVSFSFSFRQNLIPLISNTRKTFSLVVRNILLSRQFTLKMIIGLVLMLGGLLYEVVDETFYILTKTQPVKIQIRNQKLDRSKTI